jgi:hypothetical protein
MANHYLTTRVQPRFRDGMGEVCLSAWVADTVRHRRRRA